MTKIILRPLGESDTSWLRDFLTVHWGSPLMVTRGRLVDVSAQDGWAAHDEDNEVQGLITYESFEDGSREITCLESRREGQGIGSRLVQAVLDDAKAHGCTRLWLITTNDNMNALRFYQKRGFVLKAVYPNAVAQARVMKPEIPVTGFDNIPIRDEIELEYVLT